MTIKNKLDKYRFEYFSQSYSPLGRINQEKLKQQVVNQLTKLISDGAELVFVKKLID